MQEHPEHIPAGDDPQLEEMRSMLFNSFGADDLPTEAIGPVLLFLKAISVAGQKLDSLDDLTEQEQEALDVLGDFLVSAVENIVPVVLKRTGGTL